MPDTSVLCAPADRPSVAVTEIYGHLNAAVLSNANHVWSFLSFPALSNDLLLLPNLR